VNPRAPQYLAGRLPLAMPGMVDQRFDRAVIAMCIHDDQARSASASARSARDLVPQSARKMSASIRV
jgi:hypothetical protein